MPESNGFNFFKERKLFADELVFVSFSAPFLLVSLTIGTIVWAVLAMTTSPEMMGSWEDRLFSWVTVNMMVAIPVLTLSYPFLEMVDSSVCALVNSISDFKNIPFFAESPKLNILLLVYGYSTVV